MMSLRAFHFFFIALANVIAYVFGIWGINTQVQFHEVFYWAGLFSLVMGVGLSIYAFWFYRKTKTSPAYQG